ncbi:MAG: hypothetical protein Hens3KO_26150 [Henriciella sp.]
MTKISILLISLALPLSAILPASALSAAEIKQCQALGASMKVRHVELTEKGESRKAIAADVEALGELWEEAETIRNFSRQHAADADEKKAVYEAKKSEFRRIEMSFQADANQLNRDVADYNAVCSAD